MTRTCAYCGDPLPGSLRADARYCNRSCQRDAYRAETAAQAARSVAKLTQVQRVLRMLERGPVNVTDFAAPNVIDGGRPVMRMAARVQDLRDQGYQISTKRLPNGTAQYELAARATDAPSPPGSATADCNTDDAPDRREAEASSAAASEALAPLAGGGQLFPAHTYTRARHHYQQED